MQNILSSVRFATLKIGTSLTLLLASGAASMFFPLAVIPTLFLCIQLWVQVATYDPDTQEAPFMERILLGPLKILVPLFMVGSGIPIENHFWGGLWIGAALLFLCSGFKDIYHIIRLSDVETIDAPTVVTAKQRTKAAKEEDALLADLASFFTKDDDEEGTNR